MSDAARSMPRLLHHVNLRNTYLMKYVQVLQVMKLNTQGLNNLLEASHIVCGRADF